MYQNKEIDSDILSEITRSNQVNKKFRMLDIIVSILFISSFTGLWYLNIYAVDSEIEDRAFSMIEYLAPALDVMIALLLVVSSSYLTNELTKSTGA